MQKSFAEMSQAQLTAMANAVWPPPDFASWSEFNRANYMDWTGSITWRNAEAAREELWRRAQEAHRTHKLEER